MIECLDCFSGIIFCSRFIHQMNWRWPWPPQLVAYIFVCHLCSEIESKVDVSRFHIQVIGGFEEKIHLRWQWKCWQQPDGNLTTPHTLNQSDSVRSKCVISINRSSQTIVWQTHVRPGAGRTWSIFNWCVFWRSKLYCFQHFFCLQCANISIDCGDCNDVREVHGQLKEKETTTSTLSIVRYSVSIPITRKIDSIESCVNRQTEMKSKSFAKTVPHIPTHLVGTAIIAWYYLQLSVSFSFLFRVMYNVPKQKQCITNFIIAAQSFHHLNRAIISSHPIRLLANVNASK